MYWFNVIFLYHIKCRIPYKTFHRYFDMASHFSLNKFQLHFLRITNGGLYAELAKQNSHSTFFCRKRINQNKNGPSFPEWKDKNYYTLSYHACNSCFKTSNKMILVPLWKYFLLFLIYLTNILKYGTIPTMNSLVLLIIYVYKYLVLLNYVMARKCIRRW